MLSFSPVQLQHSPPGFACYLRKGLLFQIGEGKKVSYAESMKIAEHNLEFSDSMARL